MNTADIPKDGPSDWRREPSERVNALLGKLGEEAAELSSRCCRSMIQGLYERDPGDQRLNLEHLQDEIADVSALIELMTAYVNLSQGRIWERRQAKVAYKRPWFEALPE